MTSLSSYLYRLFSASFQENFIIIVLAIFAVVIIITVMITAWKTRVDNFRGAVDDFKETVNRFMDEIRSDIKHILERLPFPPTIQSGSPTTLTELGGKVAEEIKVDEWIPGYAQRNKDKFQRLKHPYDIQEECLRHAKIFLINALEADSRQDIIEALKMSAYQNGLQIDRVLEVVGIKLRDEILKLVDTRE